MRLRFTHKKTANAVMRRLGIRETNPGTRFCWCLFSIRKNSHECQSFLSQPGGPDTVPAGGVSAMPAFAERATVSLKLSPVSVFAVKYLYPAYGVFSTGEADLTAALLTP